MRIAGKKLPIREYRFRAKKGNLRVRILYRPGLWMASGELARVLEDLKAVVSRLGNGELNYGVFLGDKAVLERTVLTLVYETGSGKPVAFNALQLLECAVDGGFETVHHMGVTAIDPDYHGARVSRIVYG